MEESKNAERLRKLFAVSNKIRKLSQKRFTPVRLQAVARDLELLHTARDRRRNRAGRIGANHRYVTELLAIIGAIDQDDVLNGLADADAYTEAFDDLFQKYSSYSAFFNFSIKSGYPIDSGRYDRKTRWDPTRRFICTKEAILDNYLLVAYRNVNTRIIDSKNVADEIGVINFSSQRPMSILKRCGTFMTRVVVPSLKRETDYGFCTESQRSSFFHGLDKFSRFLKSSEFVMSTRQTFEIHNNLYKGNLLANFQIRNTATDYKKVKFVETFFYRWMKQIQIIIVEGLQIQRDNPESGPLQLLEYWRRMLNRYISIIEFVGSKPFENHYKCLVLSRSSKIITQWRKLDNTVTKALNEAKDNVRYITSLQKFWDPVYRHNPFEIMDNLPGLFTAIRNVSKTAHFFNTCSNLTGLLVKITNQITLSCKAFLTNNYSTIVWKIPPATLLKNIEICEKLMEYYKALYFATIEDMRTHNESKWKVSSVYIFTYLMKMMERMNKLKAVLKTYLTYKVLEKITISGTENCAAEIKEIQSKISARNPDALNYRLSEFDKDFQAYMKSVESVEDQLREFLKANMAPLPNTESMLLMIKRYEKLRLECICTDRRYLEVASKLETEIFVLKDVYNSERDAPMCGRNTPPASGRIQWIRMLLRRLTLVMKAVQNHPCVLAHEKSQRTARYFNYMFGLLYHYEISFHKGWFDYADEIKDLIHQPVLIRKNVGTAIFKVNLHPGIRKLINEAERFVKLKIEIPTIALIITYCKEKIINTAVRLYLALRKYDEYRRGINAIFIYICKFQLKDLENLLKPGLSTITWCSEQLEDFVTAFEKSLDKRISFYKDVIDTLEIRIVKELDAISNSLILVLPDSPILAKEYLDRSNKLRQEVERENEKKSVGIERSVIYVINKFVDLMHFPINDAKGKRQFQLTFEKINEENWKYEQILPTDKYDWIQFEKINRPIFFPTDDLRLEMCFKSYETSKYELNNLRNDCMDLFSYFNSKIIGALVQCGKKSLDTAKLRIFNPNWRRMDINSLLIVRMELILHDECCYIFPALKDMHALLRPSMQNIVDSNYFVTSWGKQAKTPERQIRRITADENRHERHFFKLVDEHKDIVRGTQNISKGLMMFKEEIDELLQTTYLKYKYLWDESREQLITSFAQTNPLIAEIREQFIEYDGVTASLQHIRRVQIIGPIEITCDQVMEVCIIESKKWKEILGQLMSENYKKQLDEMVDFIKEQASVLSKPVNDLDDVKICMDCLERIRENFIDMDMNLDKIVDTYALFAEFHIDIPKEDFEKVDSLKLAFNNMIDDSKTMTALVCAMEGPLLQELNDGVTNFVKNLAKFNKDFETKGPMVPGLTAKEASDRVFQFQNKFDELCRINEMLSSGEKLFGLTVTEYPILNTRKREFNFLTKLYSLYIQVLKSVDEYSEKPWNEIDIETISAELQDYQLRCRKLPKAMQTWPAYIELKEKIDSFNESCPLIELMTDKAIKDRHWVRLNALLGTNFDPNSPKFTLGDVLAAPILINKEEVEDICIGAVKELDIEAKLNTVKSDWGNVYLKTGQFKTRGELLLRAGDAVDIIASLEDSIMVMNSLASNRYNAPFKKDIVLWLWKLVSTGEILERWLVVQNLWMYLEAVFVGGDISRQLPAEAKRFANIDKNYVKIMHRAREIPNAVECCTSDEVLATMLKFLLQQLEQCQKSLTSYLELKRLIFPRFFFISDPVLLEILGQASNPQSIQPHLLSLFDAMAYVDFNPKAPDTILNMNSANNEKVPFENIIQCIGSVETWLGKLLKEMLSTIKTILAAMAVQLMDPEFNFVLEFPKSCGQVGLVGVQLLWTRESEISIRRSKVDRGVMKKTNQRFLNILNSFIDLTIMDLTKLDRIRFETMVTIHVHQRDIFDDLTRMKVKSILDFEWQKQARFYYDENTDDVIVAITDVNFIYQDEYLGVTERLAITPLTDRCYITLAQAIGMSMGGAPAGPAGTGKTETTKDMGRALGKFVVVFNCSDQMDFRGLGRIFKGLAQSGSWGCFDEFNRIELPVLSVAAQQIYIVLSARKEKKTSFLFSDGDTVSLNPEFGLFITMNPGYAGRQELPENLKIMFRTVAMMVPDRQIIMRVKLASCGFKENVVLARKFFTLYKLCEEQLSKQVHYDFGLRNILSCLRTLGSQKRANPLDSEETIVMRVLRDMNLSKLIDEDEGLFLSLIEDMFPGIKLTSSSYKELQRAIGLTADEMRYINCPTWNLKVVQLYETSLVRHGLMLMGPTGSGKTSCIKAMLRAYTEMGKPHREMRMNPKAITAPQMFGRLDAATNDWTDGIFSTLWRRTLKLKKEEYCWIVLDGPVDAIWIENLNSVLDDNKTLTLANGDRIKMAENSKLVFEPDNVDNASPATVSRVGMTFLSSSVLPWAVYVEAWIKKLPHEQQHSFKRCFDALYEDTNYFVQTKLIAKMRILEAIYAKQMLQILDGLKMEAESSSDRYFERIFLFALMWTMGAVLEIAERDKLDDFLSKHHSRLRWPKRLANEKIFEYYVDPTGNWQHWNSRVEMFMYPEDSIPEFSSILVPNVDNVRTAYLIELIAKQKLQVLLIGEQGTAKTVMIKAYLAKYNPEEHVFKSFNFSSATTPNMYQKIIESYVEKRVGLSYGPPGQRKMSVFIDDINMPIVNAWGDQITNEIVRQMIEQTGFYSLERPGDFLTILDIQIMAAMIHPGGGRNDIPNRLKRHMCTFNCTLPSDSSTDQIFSCIGEGYFCLARFTEDVVRVVALLVPLTRLFWQSIKTKMLPTPANFHYVFNLRDLSRIWEGILTVAPAECRTSLDALKLWKHECTRVIADKLTSFNHKDWFFARLKTDAKKVLPGDIFEEFPDGETFFVDFLREAPEATEDDEDVSFEPPKIYEEFPSWEFLIFKVVFFMTQFNEFIKGFSMDLVLFKDCLIHLMIISRIVRTPRGHALLVGVGGSGKQSLTRLASFIAGYRFHQIVLTRSYTAASLLDDLKHLYRVAGLIGQGITFIFTDNDIKDEGYLEFINNILSSGEIANLFLKDELDEILNEITPIMKKQFPKRPPTLDNLYDYFLSRAKYNLHIALCFSPVGEKFRGRSLKFPGLISGCTIDWFQKWPEDARVAVSRNFLQEFSIICTEEVKEQVIVIMSTIHENVANICDKYYEKFRRSVFVTPKSLMSFIKAYKVMYTEKRANINVMSERMSSGLYKLDEAAESVEILKLDLIEMNKIIVAATEEADTVLIEVAKQQAAAEIIKADVAIVKTAAEQLVKVIAKDKEVAEAKLEKARPALEEAEAALRTIKATDIATVRKLGKPPYLITLIMDAVVILFRRKLELVRPDYDRFFLQPSWNESLKVMSDTAFLKKIVEYQTDTINAEMIDLLFPYFRYPHYNFNSAKLACGNVAGLLSWTMAMAKYYDVNKEVLPLKANLAIQEAKYNRAAYELFQAEEMLRMKELELLEVQNQFEGAMSKKENVLEQAGKVQAKMDAATALIDGLAGEKIRWTEQIASFKSEIDRLVGDSIYLTAFLSYAGPFNQEYRTLLQNSWLGSIFERKIPVSSAINIIDSLVERAQISEWSLQGLPSDDLSTQNGIIATKAARFPLLIDPQSQGKAWIKTREKVNGLITTTLSHKYFRTYLEDCVSLGWPLLIEDVAEELDPCMDNILDKTLVKVGTQYKMKISDKEVDFSDKFKLYITTKLPNPLYSPEISARTAIIDFTVTMKGLEDQLLGRVILTEKKELEEEKTNLVETVTSNLKLMKELEANLLHKLSTVEGSLLDDVSVIQVLNKSQRTATEVKEKIIIAKATEIKINAAREEYRPIASRGSILYFLVCSMTLVNCMYQTSLVQFLERFDYSMHNSKKTHIVPERVKRIINFLTYEIYRYKSRGLYEAHKILFVLLMALNIDQSNGAVTYDEFQTFIKGGAALNLNECRAKPFKWIGDEPWLNLIQLTNLRVFAQIPDQVVANERGWRAWFQSDYPELEVFPDGYSEVDPFKKLLLIRSFVTDRSIPQAKKYIAFSLGPPFAEPVILNFDLMLGESKPLTPIICFLSMGSDPSPNIEALAKKNELKCYAMSMGQGQEVHARNLVATCTDEGGWVLLQNCHLGLDYMYELVQLLLEMEKNDTPVNDDFRVWITTEVHPKFPITLLQMAIKFTNEPPYGIRAGLKRTYGNMSQDFLDASESPFYHPLVFAVSFLHTVVQERRKYGPLGWNIPYEFNFADWYASCQFMQNHLEDLDPKRGISWQTVRYMLGEIQYGGRVTDDYDKRLLNTFAKVWFSDAMFLDTFNFFKGYKIKVFKSQEEYLESIETLPAVDPPQVYGFHSNADITFQTNTTRYVLDTVMSIQPKESSGGGSETREERVSRITNDMKSKMPMPYDLFEVKQRIKEMGVMNPMNIFLRQEIDRIQRIIILVRTTLRDLLLAIEGTIIMSEQLRDALDNIFNAKVPDMWKKGSWLSSSLGFWFTELLDRNRQFYNWCYGARPICFWMSGFFNPQGFLTAMKQEVARAHRGWALDLVVMQNEITKMAEDEIKKPPREGVFIHGLYIDGAGWDRRNAKVIEATNKVLYVLMPVVHVYAISQTRDKPLKTYQCPVYKKPNRTDLNYICPLQLESYKPPEHWILRGVALLCDIK